MRTVSYEPPTSPQGTWAPPPPSQSPYQAPPQVPAKVPSVAWLIPLAALLAVIGAVTPWFAPEGSFHGELVVKGDNLYSWKDGKIGLLPPILLLILAIGVVGLLLGRSPARFSKGSHGPVTSAARSALVMGVVSLVAVIVAWFLVTSQYHFAGPEGQSYSWDFVTGKGVDMSRSPQIGYFLTIAAAVLALVAGGLMLATKKAPTPAAGETPTYAPPPADYGPPAGH
jgi:hypothetical protein